MTVTTDRTGTGANPDEQLGFIGQFEQLLSLETDPSLTLINIYQELPISNSASICEIRGRHLELTTSELQLAAIAQCNEVYIRSPHLNQPVRGRLDSIDIRRHLVRLCDFSSAVLVAEKRQTVRVRLQTPINVILHADAERVNGVVQDISLGGCCINATACTGLREASEIRMEIKLAERSSGLPNSTRIPCTLLQITGDSAPFRCAFTFRHNQQTEDFVSALINQRQIEILRELRETL